MVMFSHAITQWLLYARLGCKTLSANLSRVRSKWCNKKAINANQDLVPGALVLWIGVVQGLRHVPLHKGDFFRHPRVVDVRLGVRGVFQRFRHQSLEGTTRRQGAAHQHKNQDYPVKCEK